MRVPLKLLAESIALLIGGKTKDTKTKKIHLEASGFEEAYSRLVRTGLAGLKQHNTASAAAATRRQAAAAAAAGKQYVCLVNTCTYLDELLFRGFTTVGLLRPRCVAAAFSSSSSIRRRLFGVIVRVGGGRSGRPSARNKVSCRVSRSNRFAGGGGGCCCCCLLWVGLRRC